MPDARIWICAFSLVTAVLSVRQSAAAADSHAVVAVPLADNLVGHATLDGADVTGVRDTSECVTEFSTTTGNTLLNWSEIQDLQVRYDGRYMVLPVQHDGTVNQIRIPRGPNANRVRSSFTLLYLDCHPK